MMSGWRIYKLLQSLLRMWTIQKPLNNSIFLQGRGASQKQIFFFVCLCWWRVPKKKKKSFSKKATTVCVIRKAAFKVGVFKRKVDMRVAIWQIPRWSHPGILGGWSSRDVAGHSGLCSPDSASGLGPSDAVMASLSLGASTSPTLVLRLLITGCGILLPSTHPNSGKCSFPWLCRASAQQPAVLGRVSAILSWMSHAVGTLTAPRTPLLWRHIPQPCLWGREWKKRRPPQPPRPSWTSIETDTSNAAHLPSCHSSQGGFGRRQGEHCKNDFVI